MDNKSDLLANESLTASKFPKHYQPPFEDEQRRTEFIADVQLRCENILKQVCRNRTTVEEGASNDPTKPSEIDGESLSEFLTKVRVYGASEMNEREQISRRIDQRVERINELVRQKVSERKLLYVVILVSMPRLVSHLINLMTADSGKSCGVLKPFVVGSLLYTIAFVEITSRYNYFSANY